MALLLDLLVAGQTRLNDDTYAKNIYADKFIRTGSSDLYVLLGGGGHKLLSDFSMAHSHPYLPLAGGWMDTGAQIYFKGLNQSTSVWGSIGYRAYSGNGNNTMHNVTSPNNTGALYITTNGYDSANDYGGLAIDNDGVTAFGAGDSGSVFRVINEDNVADGAQFYVTKAAGAVVKRSLTANNFVSNVATGTQPYACTSTTCNTNLNADLLDGKHATNFLAWSSMQSIGSSSPFQDAVNFFNNLSNLNNGGKLVYNHAGAEYTELFTRRSDSTAHGTILKWGYADKYIRIIRIISGESQSTDWEKISAGYSDSAGNADTVDSQHFSYSNDSNSPTYLWATNSNGYSFLAARGSISVNYANSAGTATTLFTNNTSQDASLCYDGSPGLHFYRFNGTGNNIGGGDGFILQWSWNPGNVGGQIYLDDNPSKIAAIRGYDSGSKTFTSWSKFIHSTNYTDYVNTTNFPGLNKVGTVTSVTVTGANGLSGTGTITSSGTITLSNAGVRSTIINGDYLRVNTNGTNDDLTIPFSLKTNKMISSKTLDSIEKANDFRDTTYRSLLCAYLGNSVFEGITDGILLSASVPGEWCHQIHFDDNQVKMHHRSRYSNSAGWSPWYLILDSLNSSVSGGGSTGGSSMSVKIANTTTTLTIPTSLPASDVYDWAKQSTKPSYSFSEITPGVATIGDGANRVMFRTHASYKSGMYYSTPGNESMVFGNINPVTSWIFATTDPSANTDWRNLTPSLQIKSGRVTINKLISDGTNAAYNLDVNGTANATTLYENGVRVSVSGHTHTKANITDFPSSLPANGGDADTVDGYHASSFSLTSHTHDYIPRHGMMNSAYAYIPTYNGETGWHRIATIKGSTGYGSYILYLCGNWSWSSNTNAIIHIDTMHTTAQLTQVSGIVGYVNKIRLVNVSNNEYYVDLHVNYTGDNTPGTVYCYFLGNGTITPRTSAEKITDSVTASAEISLVDGGRANSAASVVVNNSDANSTYRMVWHSGNTLYSTDGIYCNPYSDILNAKAFTLNGASSAGTNYITGTAGRIYFGGNFHIDSLGSNATYINYYTANNVYLVSGSSQGNVGIGTSSPSYKLDVNGTLNATRIIVNSATYGSDSLTVGGCIRITGGSGGGHAAGLRRVFFGDGNHCCLGEGGSGEDTDWMYIRGTQKILLECNKGSTTIDINGYPNSPGFIKTGSDNNYVLLGGGGHKALSDFSMSHSHPYLPTTQVSQEQASNDDWIKTHALSTLRGHVYNTHSLEWQYLFGISSGKTYGSILRTSYGNGTPRIQVMGLTNGTWSSWREVAYDGHTHPYLPLSGGTLSGGITFKYGSNSTDQLIQFSSTDSSDPQTVYLGIRRPVSSYGPCYKDNNGNWYNLIHSGNYTTYTVKKDGTGASGTWGINISGNADTVDGQHFNWNNNKNDHTYLWAASSNGQAYLVHRASMSVNYANTASGLDLNRTSITTGAEGWYKLAYYASTDPRGSVRIGLVTTGGSFVPFYAELYVENGWGIINMVLYGRFDYISKFRFTSDSTNCYIEGYFPNANTEITLQKIKGVSYVSDYTSSWNLYTTATPGSGTVQDSENTRRSLSSGLYTNRSIEGNGFVKSGSSDSYILLGGGGHKALSDFSMSHNHPYLPLAGGWMDYAGQIYFKGLNQSTSTYATIGYRASLGGSIMHHESKPYQNSGAFYIATNGCDSANDWGGLAIDNEGVTVFGAGDTGSVFRVLNEDKVSDGAQFYVTKASGTVSKYTHSISSGLLKVTNNSNTMTIGSQNSSYGHIENSANIPFYFNRSVQIDGAIWRYNTNYGISSDGYFYAKAIYANRDGASTYGGVSLYSTSDPITEYGIAFRGTGNYGKIGRVQGDWATYFTMDSSHNRGWIFRSGGTNYASVSARGESYFSAVGTDNYIAYPRGGFFSSDGSTTGYIIITTPANYRSCTMMRFNVEIYNYSGGTSTTYTVGGYNYDNGDWYNVFAYANRQGTTGYGNLTVRFGHNGTNSIIWIGESNTSYSYPKVRITNVTLGHSTTDYNTWAAGWSVTIATTAPTNVSQTVTNPATNYYAQSAGNADSAGYASSAGSVAWDNITGKPPSFTPSSHTHDDRYYTESESDSRYVNVTGDTMTGDLHVYAHTYCGYGTGSSVIDYNVYAMYVGTNGTRTGTAGSYIGGIAFTHMIKYSGGYGYCNSPQGWIGLRTVDYPGSERSSLVFATKPGTGTSNTGDDIPIERMCITPAGNIGIGTTNPASYKLEVNGDIYSSGYVRAGSGFVKGSSSNDYVLLGGGGHKAISDFSMAHSHPYLPTAGGTMTGAINLSNTNAKLAFGSLATSPITGYKAPSLGSSGVGIYSRYGGSSDEGAIIITEDTCVIYNSADTGWNFQVMDKDIGTDMTNDATRSFGVNQNHQAWSLAGFVKSGSSDSYVLLGGGGHKAESSLSVNYANSAGSAGSAGSADNATNATNASNLKHNSNGALSSISFYVASGVSETLVPAPYYCKPAGVDSDGNTMILRMRWSSGSYGHDIYAGPNAPELWHRNTKNNTEVWRKIIDSGNIGSQSVAYATSAGNATTLEGNSASAFATAGHTHSYLPLSGGWIDTDSQIYFKGAGSSTSVYGTLGFRSTSPNGFTMHYTNAQSKALFLCVNGYDAATDNGGLAIDNDGVTVFGAGDTGSVFRVINEDNVSDGAQFYVTKSSGVFAKYSITASSFYESSDERLKDFYNSIDVDLDKLSSLPKKFFKWKSNPNGEFEIGTSAQELQKIYPQLVNYDDKGYLTVAYDKLSIIALRAIDKLYEMNKNLERRIQILESKH